jgi:hypothetical protein
MIFLSHRQISPTQTAFSLAMRGVGTAIYSFHMDSQDTIQLTLHNILYVPYSPG